MAGEVFLTLALLAPAAAGPPVATVNGIGLQTWEADREFAAKLPMSSFHGNVDDQQRRELKRAALDALVVKELKRQWARANRVSVDAREVDAALAKVRARFDSPAAFRAALEAQGADEAQFRRAFERDAAAAAVDRRIAAAAVAPSPAAVRTHFDAHQGDYVQPETRHVAHLLFPVAPDSTDADWAKARTAAEAAAAKVRAGATTVLDLANAGRNSLAPRLRDQVGDLGFVHRGSLVREVDAAVFAAPTRAVVGPLQTIYGVHVLQVLEIRPPVPLPFERVEAAIAARLLADRKAQAQADFERKTRAAATITVSTWAE